jgi:vacuole morphology and inheritance protein 14
MAGKEEGKIDEVIKLLSVEFVGSKNLNHRKGGLIGLAAAALGLLGNINNYLHLLLPPVIACASDADARVAYYACESMYNIGKFARRNTLDYFQDIFDALVQLYANNDVTVKNGAAVLDRLLKVIGLFKNSPVSYLSTFLTNILPIQSYRTLPPRRKILIWKHSSRSLVTI